MHGMSECQPHVCECLWRQKRMLCSLELGLLVVMNHVICMLRTELRTSSGAQCSAQLLNAEPSLHPYLNLKKCKFSTPYSYLPPLHIFLGLVYKNLERVTLNSFSSWPYLPSAEITSICHHILLHFYSLLLCLQV